MSTFFSGALSNILRYATTQIAAGNNPNGGYITLEQVTAYVADNHNHDADYAPLVHDHAEFLTQAEIEALPGFGGGGGGLFDALILLGDQKDNGTPSGTFASGAPRIRDINTEWIDTADICSISGNQITLAAGSYFVLAMCPCYQVKKHQAWLYNYTTDTRMAFGSKGYCYDTYYAFGHSIICSVFTLDAQNVLEVHHECLQTKADSGFGIWNDFSPNPEVFTVILFLRVAS